MELLIVFVGCEDEGEIGGWLSAARLSINV